MVFCSSSITWCARGTVCLAILLSLISHSAAAEQQDFSRHPLYEKYVFGSGDADRVLDLATQPFAVPIGVIGEVMKRDRIFRKALQKKGWQLRVHPFMKGVDINFFLARGEIDAMLSGDMPTITAAATQDIVIIGLAKQGMSAIVAKGPIQIKDLKGKRIGYPAGSTAHYALITSLSLAGLSEASVTMTPLEIDMLPEALMKNSIDAFAAWEPAPTMALARYPEFSIVQRFLNSSYISLSGNLMRFRGEIAELTAASYLRALSWLRRDRNNLLTASSWLIKAGTVFQNKPYDATVDQIAAITERDVLSIASSPLVPQADYAQGGYMERSFERLKKDGKIPQSVEWQATVKKIDRSLLSRVLAERKKNDLARYDYDL